MIDFFVCACDSKWTINMQLMVWFRWFKLSIHFQIIENIREKKVQNNRNNLGPNLSQTIVVIRIVICSVNNGTQIGIHGSDSLWSWLKFIFSTFVRLFIFICLCFYRLQIRFLPLFFIVVQTRFQYPIYRDRCQFFLLFLNFDIFSSVCAIITALIFTPFYVCIWH